MRTLLAAADLWFATIFLAPLAVMASVLGFHDEKGGAVEHGVRFFAAPTCHHRPDVYGGINESEAAALLKDFFRERR